MYCCSKKKKILGKEKRGAAPIGNVKDRASLQCCLQHYRQFSIFLQKNHQNHQNHQNQLAVGHFNQASLTLFIVVQHTNTVAFSNCGNRNNKIQTSFYYDYNYKNNFLLAKATQNKETITKLLRILYQEYM